MSSSSSSSISTAARTVVYGHSTGIEEELSKTFSTNWTVTNATISGSGDTEILTLHCPAAEAASDIHCTGVMEIVIDINHYSAGSGPLPLIQYKTGDSAINCNLDTWHDYNGVSFTSAGWNQIQLVKG